MAGGISWQEFEAIVARLQKSFSSGLVTTNDKLMGRNSGVRRQIDVAIRADVGGEELLIIVECKKWTRKVDVQAVESFAGVKDDVSAHLGIMVSTKGFSKAATNTAKAKNISLYRYEDTLKEGWPSGLKTHLLVEFWELVPHTAHYILKDGSTEQIASDVGLDFIETKDGSPEPLATVIRKIWDSLDEKEKYDRSWKSTVVCDAPERPDIESLVVGAHSTFVRGYRWGRLQCEGLVDDAKSHIKVDKWKMVFEGDLIPLASENLPPKAESLSLLIRGTHVKTKDRVIEARAKLIKVGTLELEAKFTKVTELGYNKNLSVTK